MHIIKKANKTMLNLRRLKHMGASKEALLDVLNANVLREGVINILRGKGGYTNLASNSLKMETLLF